VTGAIGGDARSGAAAESTVCTPHAHAAIASSPIVRMRHVRAVVNVISEAPTATQIAILIMHPRPLHPAMVHAPPNIAMAVSTSAICISASTRRTGPNGAARTGIAAPTTAFG